MAKSSSSSNSPGLPIISLLFLSILLLLAIDSLHLQLSRISYNDLIAPLLEPNDDRLRKTYTGFGPLDGFLTVVLTMFMPVFTWEMPELSLFAAGFAGQVPAHLALMVVEGMRKGKAWGLTFTTTWMIAMQVLGYGVTTPAYYILDLIFSSHNASDFQVRSPSKLQPKVFIPAITLGYVLPSALQLLPVSEDLHQIFLAIWQPFPIYVVFFLWLFSQISPAPTPQAGKEKSKKNLDSINHIFSLAITTGLQIHWITTILIPIFRSYIFDLATAERLSFSNVLVPHGVHWYGAATIAQASMQFLQWDLYCGGLAGLVWATTLAQRAGAWEFGLQGVWVVLKDVVIMGIPCAALKMLCRIDSAVMG